ncbi:MAG: dTDP-glucose 4,6-dehydratase [Verrucomicrobiota bacterium]|jgi:dTDP-glucose 4,6-dehydratase
MRLLVTGGCGFIGSNFIRYVLEHYQPESVTNVDLLTYAGSLVTTADFPLRFGDRYEFIRADIADREAIQQIISRHSYFAVINFAAESHVDRSIVSPADFIHSNVVGTTVLLETARDYGVKRLVQVSTDEVYGSNESAIPSAEAARLNPSSPYSASKAAADLLALAYHKTYGLDVVIIRGSNNYGPYQFPEKLIPLLTIRAMLDEPLRIYGDGLQVRDWIHVEDFCAAVFDVLMEGHAGAIYNVANGTQLQNLTVAKKVLQYLGKSEDLIQFVQDQSAHDRKYSLDSTKIRQQIGWKPLRDFEDGLGATIDWYRNNEPWWRDALQPRRVS